MWCGGVGCVSGFGGCWKNGGEIEVGRKEREGVVVLVELWRKGARMEKKGRGWRLESKNTESETKKRRGFENRERGVW